MESKDGLLSSPSPKHEEDTDMAALVSAPPAAPHTLGGGAAKRSGGAYRPTPAKTFQCRGFGDCRMVFSRSEHLARHIRKHTGERPFACHCSKQFSRLDNLRQHAQTVHADKAEENEAMMRDLTSLHATMIASHKTGRRRNPAKARPGTATGTEGVAHNPHSPTSPTFDSPVDARNRHSFAAPSPTSPNASAASPSAQPNSFLGPHSPQPIPTPPGVRRTSPFSAQSPPPPRPSTTSPFSSSAPSLPSSQPPMPSPFQNPFPHERTTTPFTPFNNPFESPQQQPNSAAIPPIPPFVPPPPQASSHDWDQPFVLGQPPLPLGKRAQRPVIDTSTPKHQRQPPSPPSATMTQQVSLDSRSPIQAPDPRRPLAQEDGNSHLFPPSSHASHLPVGHQQRQEMTSHQVPWMSAQQAGQVPPQEQHWQEQQNNEFYRYQHPPAGREQAPAPTTMEALQLGVGLGLGIDPGSGEWPPEQVMEVDMVPVSQLDGGMYAWDDRPPPLSASSSTGPPPPPTATEDEMARRTSTWTTPHSASMSAAGKQQPSPPPMSIPIQGNDLSTMIQHPSASTSTSPQMNGQGVDAGHQVLYHPPPSQQGMGVDPLPHPGLDSPISPSGLGIPEKERYRLELARQQLQQLYAQRGMRDEMAPLQSAPAGWGASSSVDGNPQQLHHHPLPPPSIQQPAMYHHQPHHHQSAVVAPPHPHHPPQQQHSSQHQLMYGWMPAHQQMQQLHRYQQQAQLQEGGAVYHPGGNVF